MPKTYYALYETWEKRFFFATQPDGTKKYTWSAPKWAVDAYATWVMEVDGIEDREFMLGIIRGLVEEKMLEIVPMTLHSKSTPRTLNGQP